MSQQRGRPGTATLPGGGGKSHLNGYIDADGWVKESCPAAGGCSRPAAEKPQETTALGCSADPRLSPVPTARAGQYLAQPCCHPCQSLWQRPRPRCRRRERRVPPPGRFPARLGCGADGPGSGACAAGKGRNGPTEAPRRRRDVCGFSHLPASPRGYSAACGAGTIPPKRQQGDADLAPEAAQPAVPEPGSRRTLGSGHRPAAGRQSRHGRDPARPLAEAGVCATEHSVEEQSLPPAGREGIPAWHRGAGSAPKESGRLRKGIAPFPGTMGALRQRHQAVSQGALQLLTGPCCF